MSVDEQGKLGLTYQDIVGLDIRMHDVTFLQQAHSEEKLMRIRSNGADIKADILAETLDNISKVHTVYTRQYVQGQERSWHRPQRLEDYAEVSTMLKSTLKTYDVLLVLRIRLLQFVQDLYFLLPGSIPRYKVSDLCIYAQDGLT